MPLHTIVYGSCNICQHKYLLGNKKFLLKNARSFEEKTIRSNGEILNKTSTASFHRRKSAVNSIKSTLLTPFINKNLSILDMSCDTGTLFKFNPQLYKGFNEFVGVDIFNIFSSQEVEFERKTETLSKEFKSKRFDLILMVNYLEYSYCSYSEIIESLSLLKKNGNICVAVPLDNNPQSNYLSRINEFSNKSFDIFLENIELPYESRIINKYGTAIISYQLTGVDISPGPSLIASLSRPIASSPITPLTS